MDKDKEVEKTAKGLAEVESPATKETPQAEESKEESPQVKEPETAEKPEKTPEPNVEAEEAQQEQSKDGKAFAKMRNRVKELEAEIAQGAEPVEDVFPQRQFETPSVQQTTPDTSQYMNTETGEIDPVKFQQAVQANAVQQASKVADQKLDEYQQTQEALKSYPELDPLSKDHDKEFYQTVRGKLLDSMMRPNEYNGKTLTYKEAADSVIGLSKKARTEVEAEGANKAMKEVADKEAASLEAGGNSGRAASAESSADVENLSRVTRKGGREGAEAIAERLKKLGN